MSRPSERQSKGVRDMVTVAQASAIKGVSENGIRVAIRDNRLPAQRVGPIYLIRLADLEAWQVIGHRPKRQRKKAEE